MAPLSRLQLASLRRPDLAEEVADLVAELAALGFQRLGGLLDVLRGTGGGVGIGLYAGDVVQTFLVPCAAYCVLRVIS